MAMFVHEDFEQQRQQMVEEQIKARGIRSESVLKAMTRVPRECFVLPRLRHSAYADSPLPLISNQTISQPYIVALMTELLDLPDRPGLCLLEVGTGSGYQAAVLAAMGHHVISIERHEEVAELAKGNLASTPWSDQVTVVVGDGCAGWPDHAPYDGIIVTAASPKLPQDLLDQLKVGANLVIPCGDRFVQQMYQVSLDGNRKVHINKGIGCRFVPLLGKDGFELKPDPA